MRGSKDHGQSLSPVVLALMVPLFLLMAGCSQQMANQPKYIPLRPASFFDDGTSARPLEPGTVPRGQLRDDVLFYTGRLQTLRVQPSLTQGATIPPRINPLMPAAPKLGGKTSPDYSDVFPFPITREVLDRGQERFDIYCSVCHDRLGTGNGMIPQRGFRHPPSYHSDRLRNAPVGYLFDVITNGFGAMADYAAQVSPRDRWAIIAYIRALQLSQNAILADVPPEERQKLASGGQP
ncbi:MAG TPA: cytochrome c [Terriglobia bacterium]|nr:cytochrome c [Terriglobia bacterium]